MLSTEAGWNQNEADWRFFLSKGAVFGVRDGASLVATAALLPYSAGNAWISMVLVTADFRRRGIATKLVDTCLDVATRRGLTTWLDATPAGATVYGPLGFMPTLQLRRLRRQKPQGTTATRPLSAGNLDGLAARDGSAMGFHRSTLLSEFSARPGSASCLTIEPWRLFATAAPRGISVRCWPIVPIRRSRWWMPSSTPRPGPWLIDAVHSQEEFLNGLVHQVGTSNGHFSACALAVPPRRLRNCHSPWPDRNLDRNSADAS